MSAAYLCLGWRINKTLTFDILFIFVWAGSSLLHKGSSLVAESGGYSAAVMRGLLSVVVSLVAEHRL